MGLDPLVSSLNVRFVVLVEAVSRGGVFPVDVSAPEFYDVFVGVVVYVIRNVDFVLA